MSFGRSKTEMVKVQMLLTETKDREVWRTIIGLTLEGRGIQNSNRHDSQAFIFGQGNFLRHFLFILIIPFKFNCN